ncbi:threonine-phosphate decarboxylase [Natranaerovirga hydrolytica]|uniref:Aminotransferase n=1 Tax=Natranaerovirga hydrolytica TaxID=680378 RepID=A0A4R1MKA1_9FIRM|nr:histidinol-phosphate transaminase [Natranaerovirga hydrolytica]TCK92450.1 threonine-phosphate decarboxylase [Natranaerovirga hydrolytica]
MTPKNNNLHFHGSDLEKIAETHHLPKDEIINYSSNVNPIGISPLLKKTLASHIDLISTYPDRNYINLRTSIAKYCDTKIEHIIVGNGSTELISLVIKNKKPGQALIVGPTYSEYEREISLGGGASFYYDLDEHNDFAIDVAALKKQLNETIDLLVICNPNNPTSTGIRQKDMRNILDHCKKYNIFVMIDETYVEFADDMDDITAIPLTEFYNNLIILRGVSKFFAAPGLRLGYGICSNEDLLKDINAKQNPWTINTLASLAGEVMFNDESYIQETKALIASEREKAYTRMGQWDSVKVYYPNANFILIKLLNPNITSFMVFDYLIQQKLMVRDCSSFPFLNDRFIRFCFLNPDDNKKLIDTLDPFLNP